MVGDCGAAASTSQLRPSAHRVHPPGVAVARADISAGLGFGAALAWSLRSFALFTATSHDAHLPLERECVGTVEPRAPTIAARRFYHCLVSRTPRAARAAYRSSDRVEIARCTRWVIPSCARAARLALGRHLILILAACTCHPVAGRFKFSLWTRRVTESGSEM